MNFHAKLGVTYGVQDLETQKNSLKNKMSLCVSPNTIEHKIVIMAMLVDFPIPTCGWHDLRNVNSNM